MAFFLLLVTFQIPSPAYLVPVMQRLDPDFHGHNFVGRDLFQTIENQRYLFWLNTGELPESMLDIGVKISGNLNRITTRGGVRRKIGRYKLSNLNKVLLTFIWIRKYPCIDTLALLFDVSSSNVSNIIHHVVPALWRHFHNQISWPTIEEWNTLRGNWVSFPNAVGCIDGTPREIYRPQVELQRKFYSGHRLYHLMNTQIIVDNLGNIVFLQAGCLGGQNGAANFLLMERIGPGTDHDMPVGALLLADQGYADTPPLLTPFRKAQIRTLAIPDKRRARRFNRRPSRCRIVVEHSIKHLKTYAAVGSLWRHPRWFQPVVVELATFLAQRHVFGDLD